MNTFSDLADWVRAAAETQQKFARLSAEMESPPNARQTEYARKFVTKSTSFWNGAPNRRASATCTERWPSNDRRSGASRSSSSTISALAQATKPIVRKSSSVSKLAHGGQSTSEGKLHGCDTTRTFMPSMKADGDVGFETFCVPPQRIPVHLAGTRVPTPGLTGTRFQTRVAPHFRGNGR